MGRRESTETGIARQDRVSATDTHRQHDSAAFSVDMALFNQKIYVVLGLLVLDTLSLDILSKVKVQKQGMPGPPEGKRVVWAPPIKAPPRNPRSS